MFIPLSPLTLLIDPTIMYTLLTNNPHEPAKFGPLTRRPAIDVHQASLACTITPGQEHNRMLTNIHQPEWARTEAVEKKHWLKCFVLYYVP